MGAHKKAPGGGKKLNFCLILSLTTSSTMASLHECTELLIQLKHKYSALLQHENEEEKRSDLTVTLETLKLITRLMKTI